MSQSMWGADSRQPTRSTHSQVEVTCSIRLTQASPQPITAKPQIKGVEKTKKTRGVTPRGRVNCSVSSQLFN